MGLKLHVLDLGRVRHDINFAIAHGVVATIANPNPPAQLIDIPNSAYLIEHSDGNVLFDTGCHPDCMKPDGRWPEGLQAVFPHSGGEECDLPNRLEALGLGPDQIRYVVLSHLHMDHAGCVEFFRKSQLIVHEDELSSALRHFALHDHGSAYIWKDIDQWVRKPLNWRLIGREEPNQRLVDGVRLLNFGVGHAYGMLGLHVDLRSQADVMLVSDACYNSANYGPPAQVPGYVYDAPAFLRTLQKIRAMAGDTGSEVWFGHDLKQFDTLMKSTEGFYE